MSETATPAAESVAAWLVDTMSDDDQGDAPRSQRIGDGQSQTHWADARTEDLAGARSATTGGGADREQDQQPTSAHDPVHPAADTRCLTDLRLDAPAPAEAPAVCLDQDRGADGVADESAAGASRDAASKRVAALLAVALVVAVTLIVGALVVYSDGAEPAGQRPDPTSAQAASVAATLPVPTMAPPTVPQDQSIPYTASAPCAGGSTSAQSLTDTATDSAWVCARGSRDEPLEGKVLSVDLAKSYMISGVEVTPGAVAKTPGGQDQWLQHRVVTRLQYIFLNGNVVSDIFTQDTGNVHGPVTAALPRRVLASRVHVVVLQTSRPPSSPLPVTAPGALPEAQPGLVEGLLGEGGGPLSPPGTQTADPYPDLTTPESGSDPVDNTFAMSSLKFLGYPP